MTNTFDFTPLLRAGLPPAAAKFTGVPKYNFVGGHGDPDQFPVDGVIAAANSALRREGRTLATYGFGVDGPQGHRGLREFLVKKLKSNAGIDCTIDNILITSGSLQALDLVNGVFLAPGDTVVIEQDCYQGTLTRYARLGVTAIGIPLDRDGMRIDALSNALDDLKRRGVRPKFIYTIPTVHNPTCTILPEDRRVALLKLAQVHDVPIFEDDCYCDIIWDGERPPALYAMSQHGGVVHIGSFSKSIGPALRVGYIVAPWELMSRILPLKQDAGSGAIEQMVLAEYCSPHFNERISALRQGLRRKRDTMKEALNEQFGTAAEFEDTRGGMFLWVKLPDNVDTMKLFQPALAAGVAINPGPEWSVDKAHSKSRMRLCFAGPTHDEIRQGIAALAEVCHKRVRRAGAHFQRHALG